MSEDSDDARPAWETRREIAPYALSDQEIQRIVDTASHAVVSWVTKDGEPSQAVMLYVVVDGIITVTSTTNRAKYHAWRRNPAASFCIWDPANIGRQITLRGNIEIVQSAELLHSFTAGFLTRGRNGEPPSQERLAQEIATFDAPDRHMMQLRVTKTLSHDLPALMAAERAAARR